MAKTCATAFIELPPLRFSFLRKLAIGYTSFIQRILAHMILTILNIIFCIAFCLFAYVNLNDKDGWLWVLIYLLAAVCCGFAAFNRYYPAVYIVAIAFYLIYAVVLFFARDGVLDWIIKYRTPSLTQSMQATRPYIEKAREFFGLLIASVALIVNYVVSL